MPRAPVPEAPLDKDNHPTVWKHKVHRGADRSSIASKSYAVSTKRRAQDTFGSSVLSPNLRHQSAAPRPR